LKESGYGYTSEIVKIVEKDSFVVTKYSMKRKMTETSSQKKKRKGFKWEKGKERRENK
jgi:hypothetical protein